MRRLSHPPSPHTPIPPYPKCTGRFVNRRYGQPSRYTRSSHPLTHPYSQTQQCGHGMPCPYGSCSSTSRIDNPHPPHTHTPHPNRGPYWIRRNVSKSCFYKLYSFTGPIWVQHSAIMPPLAADNSSRCTVQFVEYRGISEMSLIDQIQY